MMATPSRSGASEDFLLHCVDTAQGMADTTGQPHSLYLEDERGGMRAIAWIRPESSPAPTHVQVEFIETFQPES